MEYKPISLCPWRTSLFEDASLVAVYIYRYIVEKREKKKKNVVLSLDEKFVCFTPQSLFVVGERIDFGTLMTHAFDMI